MGRTPLHHAVRELQQGIVEVFLRNMADPDKRDHTWNTPLHLASKGGRLAAVKKLVRVTKNINALNVNDCSPLFLAARKGRTGVVKELVQRGARIGRDTLVITATRGHADAMQILLDNSKQVD